MNSTMTLLQPLNNPSLLLPYEQYYIQSLHQERRLIPQQSPGETNPLFQTVINPNPRIPHEQVSSASACIRIPHHHSHTATEHQHTSNQVCGSAHTIFRRNYHNMLHKTVNHYKTPWQPILAKHTL